MRHRAKKRMHVGGSTIIFTVIFVAVFTATIGSYLTVISSGSRGTSRIASGQQAFYAAEAGVYRMLYEANATGATSITGSLSASTYTGSYAATLANNVISSTGTVGGLSRIVTVQTEGSLPSSVQGAVTVNSSVNTSGNITIDGRDHDADGNLTGDPGSNGISAAGLITQTGSSDIGGNGIAPAHPASAGSMQQSVNPFPSTEPWDVLGVSQAWFQNNVPVQVIPPPQNFSGIYYYNPPGGEWKPADLGNSSGILIVHNPSNSATMKNLHGTFKGLIITDQMTHINGDAAIYGAVVTTNQVGNTLGNGDALVAFSREILKALGSLVPTDGWKKTIKASSWQEQAG
jgi:hypothetical protein